jgi:hypothetical protein
VTDKRILYTYIFLLVLILAVATLFRIVDIQNAPPAFFPDEANMAVDALSIMQGNFYLVTPHEGGEGALYAYLLALTFSIFGPGILQARMLTAALSAMSAGVAFAFLYRLLAPRLGNWSALAGSAFAGLGLSMANWYVSVSRQAFPQPLAVLLQMTCLAAVWWALRTPRRVVTLLAGLLLGLTAYTYVPAKLTPLVLLLYFLLDWAAHRQDSFLAHHLRRLTMIAAIGGVLYVPLLFTLILRASELGGRAAQFTILNPAINQGDPWSTLFRSILANAAGFLPFVRHMAGYATVKAMDDLTALLFVVGLMVAIWHWRRSQFLLFPVWWGVMLMPSIIAPEGAIPHLRRAVGTVVPTFALAGLGLVTPLWLIAQRQVAWRRMVLIVATLTIAFLSLSIRARQTYMGYYLRVKDDEAAALMNHIFDFELADVMTAEGDESTRYILPVDSASGTLFPESSTLAFLYQGQANYAYVWDNETSLFDELRQLAKGKTRIGVVHWKVSKHTQADPKQVFTYVLKRWGVPDKDTSHKYFDVDYFVLEADALAAVPATLAPTDVSFEGRLALVGTAIDGNPVAGAPLWTELAWRKTSSFSTNYQVAIQLEDEAGHIVGQTDKPLLNNRWHRGTGEWAVGAEERGYYLLRVDPATPPGTYRLKVVVYANQGDGPRLAPLLPEVGADLAAVLGEVTVSPPTMPPEVAALPIPHRLDLEIGDGLWLLGFDPGFTGPLRPGDRATLSLWWQTQKPLSRDLAVITGIGYGERAWPLNKPQPLGGPSYPTHEWPAGAVVRTLVDLRLPPEVETGGYNLGVRLLDVESAESLADWLLGQMQVTGRARIFEVPSMTHVIEAGFDEQVTLLGYDLDLTQVEAGGPAELTLYWQAQREMKTAYKVFVHLLDSSGAIVTQVDREPQAGEAPTTGWLVGEVVVDRIEIPPQGLERAQRIALGLYDPVDGTRLTIGETGADMVTLNTRELEQ